MIINIVYLEKQKKQSFYFRLNFLSLIQSYGTTETVRSYMPSSFRQKEMKHCVTSHIKVLGNQPILHVKGTLGKHLQKDIAECTRQFKICKKRQINYHEN